MKEQTPQASNDENSGGGDLTGSNSSEQNDSSIQNDVDEKKILNIHWI